MLQLLNISQYLTFFNPKLEVWYTVEKARKTVRATSFYLWVDLDFIIAPSLWQDDHVIKVIKLKFHEKNDFYGYHFFLAYFNSYFPGISSIIRMFCCYIVSLSFGQPSGLFSWQLLKVRLAGKFTEIVFAIRKWSLTL